MEQAYIQGCLTHILYPDQPLPTPPPSLDWDRFYWLLRRHGLGGLFYALARAEREAWPQELRDRLREDRYRALLRGDRCTEQVGTLLAALRRAAVSLIVLKGWAVIPTVYGGDHAQRPYQDIDLLVHPQDAARAERVVQALGYQGLMDEPWPGYRRRYRNSRTYWLPQDPAPAGQSFMVGLHWGLLDTAFYDRGMPVQQFLERSQPLQVAGVDVRGLAPEDDLVYSCGHLALHHEYGEALFRYYEMATLVLQTGPPLDWDAVEKRAAAWRLVLPVQRVLAQLAALWPEVAPAAALQAIAALQPTRAERWVHDMVVRNRENRPVRAALTWLTMPGLVNRFRYLLETAVPSPKHLRQRYHPASPGGWPLLYLRHVGAAVRGIVGFKSFKQVLAGPFRKAAQINREVMRELLRPLDGVFLEVGPGSSPIIEHVDWVGADQKVVIDLPGGTAHCKALGYRCLEQDAGVEQWDLEDGYVDVVVSNQCLEHIPDTDHFIGEAHRVLRDGGILLISVPNQAALAFIVLMLLTINPPMNYVSDRYYGLGNPLSNIRWHRRDAPSRGHLRLFATRAMNDLLRVYGFQVLRNHGGSWGMPVLGRFLAVLFPHYGLYTIVLAQKV